MSVPTSKTEFYTDSVRKPIISPPIWDAVPESLRMATRWVLWRLVWKANSDSTGKWDKVPFQASGKAAKANDADTWTTFEVVKAKYDPTKYDGIGFMLGGGFAGVDLDNAIDPDTGELFPWADRIVRRFATYTEVSPSGTGVKLFGQGLWTGGRHRWKHETGEIEVYSATRYFAVTGVRVGEVSILMNIQAALDELADVIPKPGDAPPPPRAPDDDELIRKATAARNGPKFSRLWAGDTSEHDGDESAADLALCGLLAFWTGSEPARIDRLFRQSGLMREKWDEKRGTLTYGERTVRAALAGRTDFHAADRSGSRSPPPAPPSGSVVPPYRPFPVHCLPPAVKEFVTSVAASVGCDPCFAALPALTLTGAAIGGALVARPKRGWNEVPALWAVVVGDSGTAKSPAADPVAAVAQCVEDALEDEFGRAMKEYRDTLEQFENAGGDGPDAPTRPVPPAREYFVIDDVTIERLIENLRTSPRGLFQQSDELANWFNGFARYKGKAGGSDAGKWLGLFDGRSISYQRKTANPGTPRDIRVRRAIVSVTGGIQPGILSDALNNPAYLNSGLAARLVFAMPPKLCVRWTDTEPDGDADRRFRRVVSTLRELPFDPKAAVPCIGLSVTARAAFAKFHDDMAEAAEGYDGGGMAAAVPKLVRVGLRLAMIHHCATEADAGRDPGKDSISEQSMRAGIELARWFEAEAERVYAMLSEKPEDRSARLLADWVRRRKGGRATARDLQRSNGRKYPTPGAAESALDALVSAGVGRWEDIPSPKSGGWAGRVFVLHPASASDARHSMPTTPRGDPTPDPTHARTTEFKTLDFLADCARVSASVGCRTDTEDEPVPTPPPPPGGGQVSDTPPAGNVRRRANPNRGLDGKGGGR